MKDKRGHDSQYGSCQKVTEVRQILYKQGDVTTLRGMTHAGVFNSSRYERACMRVKTHLFQLTRFSKDILYIYYYYYYYYYYY